MLPPLPDNREIITPARKAPRILAMPRLSESAMNTSVTANAARTRIWAVAVESACMMRRAGA